MYFLPAACSFLGVAIFNKRYDVKHTISCIFEARSGNVGCRNRKK